MFIDLMSVAAVRRSKRRVRVGACAAALFLLMGPVPASAQRPTANARACGFLPVADLEAYYGGQRTGEGAGGGELSGSSPPPAGPPAQAHAPPPPPPPPPPPHAPPARG